MSFRIVDSPSVVDNFPVTKKSTIARDHCTLNPEVGPKDVLDDEKNISGRGSFQSKDERVL